MPLLPTPTPLQLAAQAGAEAIHYAATVLRSQYSAVWDRDPVTVAAELNADVATSAQLMQLHSQAVAAVNALLDAITDGDTETALRFPTRAQTSMPECWSFSGTAFIYTAPPEPEVVEPLIP